MKRLPLALAALVMLTACEPSPPATLVIGDSNTVGNSWVTMLGPNCTPDVWAWGGVGVFWGSSTYAGGISLSNHYETIPVSYTHLTLPTKRKGRWRSPRPSAGRRSLTPSLAPPASNPPPGGLP